MEPDKKPEVGSVQKLDQWLADRDIELTIREEGHKKWLVAREGVKSAEVRLPRHLETMQPEQAEHEISLLCAELKQKIVRGKGIIRVAN